VTPYLTTKGKVKPSVFRLASTLSIKKENLLIKATRKNRKANGPFCKGIREDLQAAAQRDAESGGSGRRGGDRDNFLTRSRRSAGAFTKEPAQMGQSSCQFQGKAQSFLAELVAGQGGWGA